MSQNDERKNYIVVIASTSLTMVTIFVMAFIIIVYSQSNYYCWDSTPRNCYVAKYMTYDLPLAESVKYGWCGNETVTISQVFAIVDFNYGDAINNILIPYAFQPNPGCNYSNPIMYDYLVVNTNVTCYLDNIVTQFRTDYPFNNCQNRYDDIYGILIGGAVVFCCILLISLIGYVIIVYSERKKHKKQQNTTIHQKYLEESHSMRDAIE